MRRLVVCLVLLSIIVPGGFLTAKEEKTFHVIVNTSNPTSELTKSEISKLFLKKNKHWKELNEAVLPIDQVVDSPVRKQFSAEIHGRKISAIQAYWQKQIFSGRRVPPEEKKADQHILEYVAEHEGAIGYVSEAANVSLYNVKTVRILTEERHK
ncbi:hypothetical protein CSA56_14475 [candidate division KSB3 bacterium]|uniref:PBP domain-containing protein n=1 Tax=candidate division KSB3 bacterium TaxID=2044937 RepID=A0A2G6KBE7_9BACT|nr:MAG: hypothetical protein CSA56_14475 [candidate division KSB3 bacterium]